jgi:hypothetical protein
MSRSGALLSSCVRSGLPNAEGGTQIDAAVILAAARFTTRGARSLMPTLIRLLVYLAVIAALGYGAIFALATFVEPRQKEIVVDIPPEQLGAD